jgi:hypothetical protein
MKEVFEIVNPSDMVTIAGDDILVVNIAVLLLGRGQYVPKLENGETTMPFLMFGGTGAWLKENGIDDFSGWLDNHGKELADVFDSCFYGGFGDRKAYELAISKMTPESAAEYKMEIAEQLRSSMNNIGKSCEVWAKHFREKPTQQDVSHD